MATRLDIGLSTSDFDYPLDEWLIAQHPPARRDDARLLQVARADGRLEDRHVRDIPSLLASGDVVVVNDTRVFPARLLGRKPTGARAEVLLVHPLDDEGLRWSALVRPGGKLKPGRVVHVADELQVEIEASRPDGGRVVRLVTPLAPHEALDRYGRTPLPPYIDREADERDRERYQTVYARETGSVAAPTAGLHLSERSLAAISRRGARVAHVTLHVGPGTFRPVEVEEPAEHRLHAEPYRVTPEAARVINGVRAAGGRVWAVGTTVVRTLETVASPDGEVAPAQGWTDLFIRPGYPFRTVDRLITNFHLPRSSLLMLVAAFAGYDLTMTAYRHAVRQGYRLYSYGDAMAIL